MAGALLMSKAGAAAALAIANDVPFGSLKFALLIRVATRQMKGHLRLAYRGMYAPPAQCATY